MKKILGLIIICMIFISCSTNFSQSEKMINNLKSDVELMTKKGVDPVNVEGCSIIVQSLETMLNEAKQSNLSKKEIKEFNENFRKTYTQTKNIFKAYIENDNTTRNAEVLDGSCYDPQVY